MIRIKKLLDTAKLPEKAHAGDLGYDLFAASWADITPNETRLVRTGIAIQFPEGYGGFIKDRSSVATKRGLHTVAGVIDNGYTGEIQIALHNVSNEIIEINVGEKIAQLVLIPTVNFTVEEVDELIQQDQRGNGGFGSTGT